MADAEKEAETEEQLLQLQRMEAKLIAAVVNRPGIITRRREHQLRYAIALAALDTFQPGAARHSRRNTNPDIQVRSPRLTRWRDRLLRTLRDPLLLIRAEDERLATAAKEFVPLVAELERTRDEVLARYADQFSERSLDQELGRKTLVTIAGGGGGAGYGYIGAWAALQNAAIAPGYVIGSSMGAVLGLFRARRLRGDFGAYIRLAKAMRARRDEIFRYGSLRRRFGLPGIIRLYLHAAIGTDFKHEDGTDFLLPDLEIPYEAIVAGVRRGMLFESPEKYALSHHLPVDKRPGPLQLRAQIGAQIVRLVGFVNPRAVKEIVVGGDELTREFNAVDAAGFSAAIPGILHYDVARDDPHMHRILTELMSREEITALVDGGVANNVPARTAWHQIRRGKIGTRNCYYVAFDCFHPQYGLAHLWLQPLTRLISYQVALNDRYAHRRIKLHPTLSPLNLLPAPEELDHAVAWGREQVEQNLPYIRRFLERVRWTPQEE